WPISLRVMESHEFAMDVLQQRITAQETLATADRHVPVPPRRIVGHESLQGSAMQIHESLALVYRPGLVDVLADVAAVELRCLLEEPNLMGGQGSPGLGSGGAEPPLELVEIEPVWARPVELGPVAVDAEKRAAGRSVGLEVTPQT